MNLTYEKCGDYLIPNIIPDPEPGEELRKFGLMRKNYLKEYKIGIYHVRRSPSPVCKQTEMLPLDLHVLSL